MCMSLCKVTVSENLPYKRKIIEIIREHKGRVWRYSAKSERGRSVVCDVTTVTHLKHGVFTTELSSGFAVHRGSSDASWAARVTRCGLGLSTRRQNVTKRDLRKGAHALQQHYGVWIFAGERQLKYTVLRCNTGKEEQLVDLVFGWASDMCSERAAVASTQTTQLRVRETAFAVSSPLW